MPSEGGYILQIRLFYKRSRIEQLFLLYRLEIALDIVDFMPTLLNLLLYNI